MSNLANTDFDATQEEEVQEFTPLPVGEYPAVISSSEIVQHDSGAQTLKMTFTVLGGDYQNRLVFMRQNWQKKDRTPNKIGRGFLADACKAVGVLKPGDTAELHNKPLIINVGIERDEYQGEERVNNTVKKIKPMAGPQKTQGQHKAESRPAANTVANPPEGYQQPTASAGAWANQNG